MKKLFFSYIVLSAAMLLGSSFKPAPQNEGQTMIWGFVYKDVCGLNSADKYFYKKVEVDDMHAAAAELKEQLYSEYGDDASKILVKTGMSVASHFVLIEWEKGEGDCKTKIYAAQTHESYEQAIKLLRSYDKNEQNDPEQEKVPFKILVQEKW